MRYMLLKYIGKLEPRQDNVLPRSGRVWEHTGAVLRVPEDEAYAYLAYPAIWVLATPGAVSHELIEKANDPSSVELLVGLIGMLTQENIAAVIEQSQAFLNEPDAEDEPLTLDLADPEACKAYDQRIRRIAAAIQALPNNTDNYDRRSGLPKLMVLRNVCPIKDLTLREIRAAVALNKKAA